MHLADDDDDQKEDDVTFSFGGQETTKTLLFVYQTGTSGTYLTAMVISCRY